MHKCTVTKASTLFYGLTGQRCKNSRAALGIESFSVHRTDIKHSLNLLNLKNSLSLFISAFRACSPPSPPSLTSSRARSDCHRRNSPSRLVRCGFRSVFGQHPASRRLTLTASVVTAPGCYVNIADDFVTRHPSFFFPV